MFEHHCPLPMAKAYRKDNLAKARKFRHCNTTKSPLADCPDLPELASDSESDTDSESDCGYKGGVNCRSDECDPVADLDEDWSDDESLAELEGDELASRRRCMMVGLSGMGPKSLSRWFTLLTTQQTQMLRRASKLFSWSVAYTQIVCEVNAT